LCQRPSQDFQSNLKSYLNKKLETGLLYVKHFPADICKQRDEVFIPEDVVAKLEEIVAVAGKQRVEIEVVNYQGAA